VNRPAKNSKVFKQITQSNKTSISTNLPEAFLRIKESLKQFAPGFMFYAERMERYTRPNLNADKKYVYICKFYNIIC